jgi:hypothetical protein
MAMRQISLRKVAIAAAACTCAVLFSWNWSEQSGVALSVDSAQAASEEYYGVRFFGADDRARFAARYGAAGYYSLGGVASSGYWYRDWDQYAAINGIKCRPGSWIKMPDGDTYLCQ